MKKRNKNSAMDDAANNGNRWEWERTVGLNCLITHIAHLRYFNICIQCRVRIAYTRLPIHALRVHFSLHQPCQCGCSQKGISFPRKRNSNQKTILIKQIYSLVLTTTHKQTKLTLR